MTGHRVKNGVERGAPFEIKVDGENIIAHQGETIGAALIASGRLAFRNTTKHGDPRGMYCGIGVCHECRMVVNGKPNTRVCQTPATPDDRVQTQDAAGKWRSTIEKNRHIDIGRRAGWNDCSDRSGTDRPVGYRH
ncbi:hypothetical protein D3OALGB2SA_4058 [Olavius algarvensis associated proteobacterium Delta 3]|nr:hypothetical protein D3OALGB2SA_4058 [Olavius algarvensis associated proteobacterium Delta 3]